MRRLSYLLLLVLLVPLADAQTTTVARPSLTIDPIARDAKPGEVFNATAVFANPLAAPITWALSFASTSDVRVSYERWEVTVAPGGRERVNATIFLNNATNGTTIVHFLAQETDASVRNAARGTRADIKGNMTVHVGAAPTAANAPVVLSVEPSLVQIPRGGNATARLLVANRGPAIDAPQFELKPVAGVEVRLVDPPATIPANATVPIVLRFLHTGDAAAGTKLDGGVALRGGRASLGFPILIAEPKLAVTAPPKGLAPVQPTDLSEAAATEAAIPAEQLDERIAIAAALGAAGVGWSALWLSRHKWLPLLAALYTRLRPNRMLEHPLRQKIVELVKTNPGITFGELARRLDIAPGQLTHHARMLEKAGIVFSSPDGQTRRFFHVGHGRLEAVPPLAERTLAALQARPMRASDLAKELGVSRQSLHYHVKMLVADGRIVALSEGGETILAVASSSATAGA